MCIRDICCTDLHKKQLRLLQIHRRTECVRTVLGVPIILSYKHAVHTNRICRRSRVYGGPDTLFAKPVARPASEREQEGCTAAFQSPRANGAHDFPSGANRSIHVPTGNFPFAPLEKWRRFF